MRHPRFALFFATLLAANFATAANIWTDTTDTGQRSDFAFRSVKADESALRNTLSIAPLEFSGSTSTEIELPMPDGSNQQFRIEESPVLAPELAAKFPAFKTYRAFGVDEPTASGRIGLVDGEFHGLLHTEKGTVWIESVSAGANYRSYYKRDYAVAHRGASTAFSCGVQHNPSSDDSPVAEFRALARTDGARRNYRLAVATTGEYSAFHGGTVNSAMAAVTTTMNRVNQIYNRDLNVHMTLVANNNALIYTNSGSDPYTNNNGFTMLGQNQSTLDNVIGTANYDIGHVFSTGGGGVASLGAVCSASRKAQGVTGLGSPVGDPFDIDYVAHEIGHQFGGNHTFNGSTGNCAGGNRNGSTAFEPGSGNTIMAYAGICGAENTARNSIAAFHAGSIAEMTRFISGGGSCFTTPVASSNAAPSVNAGSDYTIPRSTPFVLTGAATDPNGDTLTYQWDQLDAGSATNASNHGSDIGSNALFRSFLPSAAPSRTLPRLGSLNANTTDKAETLPTTARVLDFRLIARDQKGGVESDDMRVTVNTGAGPFKVTQPNAATTLDTSQQQVVEWDVACTDAAPVSCSTVDILLSTDGGNSYPTTLIAATPNDGEAAVTITAAATSTARIRVQCSSNIFFDVSDSNFSLASNSGSVLAATGNNHNTCGAGNNAPTANAGPDQTVGGGATVNLNAGNSSDPDSDPISYAWSEVTATGVVLNGADTATPSFTAPSTAATVTLRLTVSDNKGASGVDTVTITVNAPPPANSPPIASAGADQSADTGAAVTLDGSASRDPDSDPISYAWSEVTATGITLNNADTTTPTFTAPANATTVTVQLTVTDNKGASASDTVNIVVNQPTGSPTPPTNGGGSSAGGSDDAGSSASAPGALLILTGIALLRIVRRRRLP